MLYLAVIPWCWHLQILGSLLMLRLYLHYRFFALFTDSNPDTYSQFSASLHTSIPGFPLQLRMHLQQWPVMVTLQELQTYHIKPSLKHSLWHLRSCSSYAIWTHRTRLLYITKSGCQHEMQPWLPLDHIYHVLTLKEHVSLMMCSPLNHNWLLICSKPVNQRSYFSGVSLSLITVNSSALAD